MGGKSHSTSDPKLNGINVQQSTLGLPLAIGWGRNRVSPNLIDYVAFTAIPHTTKQSAGKGLGGSTKNTTYTYTASIVLGIGEGPITGIRTVYKDKAVYTGSSALSQVGLSLASGTLTQAPWGYMTSKFPSHALAYSGIAYVYAQDYALNDSASLPNHSFEVDWPVQLAGLADADPKDVLTDFLTNASHGLPSWGAGLLGDLSDWSLYCRASNLLLSPVLDSQTRASDTVTEWMTATNSAPFWSEGLLKVRPYGDTAATGNGVTWTPNLTPIYDLTEDDFIPDGDGRPVVLDIEDQSDAYNIVQVEYLDRANQYNTAIATAQDLDNIVTFGRRKQDPTTVHSICDATVAQAACQLLLQRTLYVRDQYKFTVPEDYSLLEPMDLVTLTTTTDELQLSRQLVRILEIDEDESGNLTMTAEPVLVGTAHAALYAPHSAASYAGNVDEAPGSVTSPVLINAPTSLTGGAPEVWCAASSTSATWGGCEVWISVDGDTYSRVGTITGPARYGVLTATLPSHSDPDGDSTLAIDLSASQGALGSATEAEANAGGSLCLVGSELITYQDATLTGSNAYSLTELRRGFQGTAIGSHGAGTQFVRLDDAVFRFGYQSLNVGSTIHVKLPSFNVFGRAIQDLADCTAYSVSLLPATAKPETVTGLALAQAWTGSTLQLTWNTAARATSYKVNIYASDETTLLRQIVTSSTTAIYSAALAAQDGVQRAYAIEVVASNDAGDAGASAWLTVSNPAPPAVSSPGISGGTTTATATCTASTASDVAAYILFYSATSGFDPHVTGGVVTNGLPSIAVFGLAAGTYYGRIAAYDAWTSDPRFLNLSSEISFTITSGGGSTPSGGGTEAGGFSGAGGPKQQASY